MSKNIHTPREDLICGKLDAARKLAQDLHAVDLCLIIDDIRHDAERMEAKLFSRKDEAARFKELSDFHYGETPLPEKASLYLTGISALAFTFMKETEATSFTCGSELSPKNTDEKYKSEFKMTRIVQDKEGGV